MEELFGGHTLAATVPTGRALVMSAFVITALVMTALHRASGAAHESHEFCSRGFKYETPGQPRLPGGDDEAWP